jgi:hypothetical protein
MRNSTTKHNNCADCPFNNQDCIYCKVCDKSDDDKATLHQESDYTNKHLTARAVRLLKDADENYWLLVRPFGKR